MNDRVNIMKSYTKKVWTSFFGYGAVHCAAGLLLSLLGLGQLRLRGRAAHIIPLR